MPEIPPTDPPTCQSGAMAQPRRIWNIALPADLHTNLRDRHGHRGLTAALTDALEHLSTQPSVPPLDRPSREEGLVEITLRLPVPVSDSADRWRARHGLSRQATVEYAVVAALKVPA